MSIDRRTFVGAALLAAGGTGCSSGKWRFFTDEEARTVEAICEQLIPADRDPGARDAGVVNYIDIQLTRHFKKHQNTYRRGIAGVDTASRKKFGKRFVELPADSQIEVLNGTEENSKTFFELILAHSRQGFYGDPRHGGNRNMASWKMLGLPCPPVRGRERYSG